VPPAVPPGGVVCDTIRDAVDNLAPDDFHLYLLRALRRSPRRREVRGYLLYEQDGYVNTGDRSLIRDIEDPHIVRR